nr:DUF4179 domain-containing protein [uncultured Oscillibacter sp.]
MKKSIRSLLCGLGAALLLLTCLPSAALAAEKSFTSMFPGYADGARDPKAAEAVLSSMGTLIGQKQTVNGVTLTLDGAIWNKDKMLLSFAIDGAKIPKDVPSDIYLNRDVMQVTLAEHQRETYVRSETVELERPFSESRAPRTQAELDASVQDQLKRGEPMLFHLPTLVRSGGKDRLLLSVSILPYVEKPELTVHMENLVLFKNAEGKYGSQPRDGCEPLTLVSGPFDFTFTAEKHLKPLVYTGAVNTTVQGIPVQVQKVTVTAFTAQVEYETLQKLDLQNDYTNETKKLDPVRLSGVWTKDGQPLKGTVEGHMGGDIFKPDPRLGKTWVTTGNTHPYVIDPASVTAVDLGGVRIDLNRLMLQENPPLQEIMIAPIDSGTEDEKKEEPTPAQTNAERAKKLEEAKKIAYQDLSAASKEMQARILEARKLIISSTSWAADGFTAYTVDENGKKTQLPHFSDLFPGWEMPKA